MSDKHNDSHNEVETTGHVWDEDLQEFDNPLPRWWLWSFYATLLFSFVYWIWYPTWPLPNGWTPGIATVQVAGQSRPWSTRTLLDNTLENSPAAINRRVNLAKFDAIPIDDLEKVTQDPEFTGFANKVGKALFSDNCATCHQQGGAGIIGLYPTLADDDWLWGGSAKQIYTSILNGRNGNMTPMKGILTEAEITDLANYVLSLSGEISHSEAADRGKALFTTKGTCFVCHGADGKGVQALGAANLTDKVWTIVDIPHAKSEQEKINIIKQQILMGVVPGQRQMPAWKDRLTDAEIKALAIYVQQLGNASQ